MKLSEMNLWARSLSNLSSSKAISTDDEDKSFNASWKDLYARLLESNDDYFTRTTTITITVGMSVGTFEWLIPLPSDFYALRTLDYQDGTTAGQWQEVEKFPLSLRNDQGRTVGYRLDNGNLWLKGQNVSSVRVKYYPPPAALTHPQPDLAYATAVAVSDFTKVSSPVYAAWKNTGVYIYNLQNIAEGSIDDNTVGTPVTLLAAAANLSNLVYYKGYLYWLQGGNIKRAPTDLVTTPIVPANIIATTTVTSFAIFKDKVYFTDTTVKSCNLDGSTVVGISAVMATWLCLAGSVLFAVVAGVLYSLVPTVVVIASGVSAAVSDGTNLYILDTSGNLRMLVLAGALLVTDTVVRTDVAAIGPWAGNRIPIITGETQQSLAISSIVDSDITYPANVVLEIMSYQAAIDFRTKIGGEFDFAPLLARLGHPKQAGEPSTGLWARFESAVKRDAFKPERVSNSRRIAGNW